MPITAKILKSSLFAVIINTNKTSYVMNKKQFISTLFLVVSLSFSALAGGEEDHSAEAAKRTIATQLSRKVSCPDFILQSMGTESLWLQFTLDTNGNVQILNSHSTNLRLEHAVVKNLSGAHITNDSSTYNQTYSIRLNFNS